MWMYVCSGSEQSALQDMYHGRTGCLLVLYVRQCMALPPHVQDRRLAAGVFCWMTESFAAAHPCMFQALLALQLALMLHHLLLLSHWMKCQLQLESLQCPEGAEECCLRHLP